MTTKTYGRTRSIGKINHEVIADGQLSQQLSDKPVDSYAVMLLGSPHGSIIGDNRGIHDHVNRAASLGYHHKYMIFIENDPIQYGMVLPIISKLYPDIMYEYGDFVKITQRILDKGCKISWLDYDACKTCGPHIKEVIGLFLNNDIIVCDLIMSLRNKSQIHFFESLYNKPAPPLCDKLLAQYCIWAMLEDAHVYASTRTYRGNGPMMHVMLTTAPTKLFCMWDIAYEVCSKSNLSKILFKKTLKDIAAKTNVSTPMILSWIGGLIVTQGIRAHQLGTEMGIPPNSIKSWTYDVSKFQID